MLADGRYLTYRREPTSYTILKFFKQDCPSTVIGATIFTAIPRHGTLSMWNPSKGWSWVKYLDCNNGQINFVIAQERNPHFSRLLLHLWGYGVIFIIHVRTLPKILNRIKYWHGCGRYSPFISYRTRFSQVFSDIIQLKRKDPRECCVTL